MACVSNPFFPDAFASAPSLVGSALGGFREVVIGKTGVDSERRSNIPMTGDLLSDRNVDVLLCHIRYGRVSEPAAPDARDSGVLRHSLDVLRNADGVEVVALPVSEYPADKVPVVGIGLFLVLCLPVRA